jgi:heme A synthase
MHPLNSGILDPPCNSVMQHLSNSACAVCHAVCCAVLCSVLKAAVTGSNKQLAEAMVKDPAGQGAKLLVGAAMAGGPTAAAAAGPGCSTCTKPSCSSEPCLGK